MNFKFSLFVARKLHICVATLVLFFPNSGYPSVNSRFTNQTIDYARSIIKLCFKDLTQLEKNINFNHLHDFYDSCIDSAIRTSTTLDFLRHSQRDQKINLIYQDLVNNYRNKVGLKKLHHNHYALLCLGLGIRLMQASSLPLEKIQIYENLNQRVYDICHLAAAGHRSKETLAYLYFRSFSKNHPINLLNAFAYETYQLASSKYLKYKSSLKSAKDNKQLENIETYKDQILLARQYYAIAARFFALSLRNLNFSKELLAFDQNLSRKFQSSVQWGLNSVAVSKKELPKIRKYILAQAFQNNHLLMFSDLKNHLKNKLDEVILSDLNFWDRIYIILLRQSLFWLLFATFILFILSARRRSDVQDKFGVIKLTKVLISSKSDIKWNEKLLIFFLGLLFPLLMTNLNTKAESKVSEKIYFYLNQNH